MIIKEKRYIKKCDCGTEIIYTRRDCYHNTTWDIYSLYCPSCSHEYSYRRGTHHDLFDKEYEEDSVDKDEEIERLKRRLEEYQEYVEINHKEIERLREELEKEKYLVDKYTRQLTDEYKNTEYQCKEKERLNNIINELEKGIKENIEELEEHQLSRDRIDEDKEILRFLQELKGSNDNG